MFFTPNPLKEDCRTTEYLLRLSLKRLRAATAPKERCTVPNILTAFRRRRAQTRLLPHHFIRSISFRSFAGRSGTCLWHFMSMVYIRPMQ